MKPFVRWQPLEGGGSSIEVENVLGGVPIQNVISMGHMCRGARPPHPPRD